MQVLNCFALSSGILRESKALVRELGRDFGEKGESKNEYFSPKISCLHLEITLERCLGQVLLHCCLLFLELLPTCFQNWLSIHLFPLLLEYFAVPQECLGTLCITLSSVTCMLYILSPQEQVNNFSKARTDTHTCER